MLNLLLKCCGWTLVALSLPIAMLVQVPWLLYLLAVAGHALVLVGYRLRLPRYGLRFRRHMRRFWLSLFWAESHQFRHRLW
ncbi:hypothetical protein [Ferrimonas balearica]|uniref:hypothetical protein n=1 Tax=Ferrimonas balearica TaxID=44012 RepID=UPI001C98EB60|nr:hypothetical protein [Ferrimonas balearica]MBY5992551.1 hypothetical protein [Ferrimonas balearica]